MYNRRKFLKIVLDPPNFEPGSWVGAGNVVYDYFDKKFIMAVRFRKGPPARGYATGIFTSKNGEDFELKKEITKEELTDFTGKKVYSIEGVQVLRDPLTSLYYLYVSIDDGDGWETILLTSRNLVDWDFKGTVLERGLTFDSNEARDIVVGIVDGTYFMLYKAGSRLKVNTALAVSSDGIRWRKLGVPTIEGEEQPEYFQLSGTIFPSTRGPLFIGLARRYVVNGCGIAKHFEAYIIDYKNMDLENVFRVRWKPLSEYEMPTHPTHGYSSIVYDPLKNRFLIYLETLDPKYTKEVGWRTQVDRWILYEVPLPPSYRLQL